MHEKVQTETANDICEEIQLYLHQYGYRREANGRARCIGTWIDKRA